MKFIRTFIRRIPIAILFVALLSTLLPTIAAADSEKELSGNKPVALSDLELKLISEIPDDAKVTAEDIQMAEKMRLIAEEEMNEAINNNKPAEASLSRSTVTLGTDATFYTADWGSTDKGKSQLPVGVWDSDYYLDIKQDEAVSIIGSGFGSAWAYAQVGKQFTVSGTGSQSANIRMSGHISGYLFVILAGSTSVKIDLVVLDETTSTKYTTNILNESRGLAGWDDWYQSFNQGVNVNLQAGHDYTSYLELKVSSGVWTTGAAYSDWGRQDGDSGQWAYYNSIVVDF